MLLLFPTDVVDLPRFTCAYGHRTLIFDEYGTVHYISSTHHQLLVNTLERKYFDIGMMQC